MIPVLVGKATRIDRSVLPDDLLELADCQYRRFDHRNAESDLAALGDTLARLLPELGAVDRDARAARERAEAKSRKLLGHLAQPAPARRTSRTGRGRRGQELIR